MKKSIRIHFMGIGGSGMSAAAQIAKAQGFEVSGCDLQGATPYSHGLEVTKGHDVSHLKNVDILAVTPAVYFQSAQHPELVEGKAKGMVMTWQEFMGKYLHKDKFVICIAGTHGKSTTTTMAGLVLEAAGLDPTVEVGATIPAWHSNVRIGKGKYFVTEADEYHHNFLHYHSNIIILNNLEMDHPEYFKSDENILGAFQQFIDQLKPNGTLIFNNDSPLIHRLKMPTSSIPYSVKEFPKNLKLGTPGEHNKANAMGVLKLAQTLNIKQEIVYETLQKFTGIARRLELIGERNGVKIYDDYANHPTAFAANLEAIKSLYPQSKIWAIIEPHTFSRLRSVLNQLPESLKLADEVIITKVFASREKDPGDFSGADIAKAANGQYIPEFKDVIETIKAEAAPGMVVLVMGSGDSYKLSQQILESL